MSNRTEQLLQQVLVPKVVKYYDAFRGIYQYSLKADISNVRYVNADQGNFGTASFDRIDLGTPDGNLFLGLSANAMVTNDAIGGTTALGVGAAEDAQNESDNVFLGWNVANNSRKVSNSVVIGAKAGQQLMNVCGGVYIGQQAGYALLNLTVSSFDTVAVGRQAARNGKGSYNVLLGAEAGYTLAGSSNVFIGNQAGRNCNVNTTGKLLITNTSAGNQGLLYGVFPANTTNQHAYLGVGMDVADLNPYNFNVSGATQTTGPLYVGGAFSNSAGYVFDVSGGLASRSHFAGDVFIDGNLTVSGGPIGQDICTGQIVLGRGVAGGSWFYPSLLALKGGAQFQDGFVQINRTEYPPVYRLDVSGDARITRTTDLGSNLNVSGATVLSNTLDVSGATRLSNTLDVSGATRLSNTLDVSGATTMLSTLSVTGDTRLSNSLFVTGPAILSNTLSWKQVGASDLSMYGILSNWNSSGFLRLSNAARNAPGVNIYGGGITPAITEGAYLEMFDAGGNNKVIAGVLNNAGFLKLQNDAGASSFYLGGARSVGTGGYLELRNGVGNLKVKVEGETGNVDICGIYTGDGSGLSNLSTGSISGGGNGVYGGVTLSAGAISNPAATSNSIGGVTLSSGAITATGDISTGLDIYARNGYFQNNTTGGAVSVKNSGGTETIRLQGSTGKINGITLESATEDSAVYMAARAVGALPTSGDRTFGELTFQRGMGGDPYYATVRGVQNGFNDSLRLGFTTNAAANNSTQFERMSIMPFSGNVGIGTVNPQCKLDVQGDICATGRIKTSADIQTTGGIFYGNGSGLTNLDVASCNVNYANSAGTYTSGNGVPFHSEAAPWQDSFVLGPLKMNFGVSTVNDPVIIFNIPYQYTPCVVASSDADDRFQDALESVRNVTTTQFQIVQRLDQRVRWIAIGT